MTESTQQSLSQYVSGGYLIVRPGIRQSYMNAALLPENILTASNCIVDIAPDTWAISWANDSPESIQEDALKFSLDADGLAELTDWSTKAFERGDLGWSGVFFDLDVAVDVRTRLLSKAEDLVVVGIALPTDLGPAFIEDTRVGPKQLKPGVGVAIRKGRPPASHGEALGHDVLGFEFGFFHSYMCNLLETEFERVFGLRPNRFGFYDGLEDARLCADHCNLESTGAEPFLWLPWMTLLYDGAFNGLVVRAPR